MVNKNSLETIIVNVTEIENIQSLLIRIECFQFQLHQLLLFQGNFY